MGDQEQAVQPGDAGGDMGLLRQFMANMNQQVADKDKIAKKLFGYEDMAEIRATTLDDDLEPAFATDPENWVLWFGVSTEAATAADGGGFGAQWVWNKTHLGGTMSDYIAKRLAAQYNVERSETFMSSCVYPVLDVLHSLAQSLQARGFYLVADPDEATLKGLRRIAEAFNLEEKLAGPYAVLREGLCRVDSNAPTGKFLTMANKMAQHKKRAMKGHAGAITSAAVNACLKDAGREFLNCGPGHDRQETSVVKPKQTKADAKKNAAQRVNNQKQMKKIKALEAAVKKSGQSPMKLYKQAKIIK